MQDREKKRESKRSCLFLPLQRLSLVFINMSGHPVYAVVNYQQKHKSGTTNLGKCTVIIQLVDCNISVIVQIMCSLPLGLCLF